MEFPSQAFQLGALLVLCLVEGFQDLLDQLKLDTARVIVFPMFRMALLVLLWILS